MNDMNTGKHPLVGLWFHTLKDGGLDYQGQVIGIDGNHVFCQLYSWADGSPTNIKIIEKFTFYSDRVVLYASSEKMNERASHER